MYQKSAKKSTGTGRARRRIDLSPSLPKNSENKDIEKAEGCDSFHRMNVRMEAFEAVWSKIESTIKEVLRDINNNVFNEIHKWISESFNNISSSEKLGFAEATQSFPIVTYATSKQIHHDPRFYCLDSVDQLNLSIEKNGQQAQQELHLQEEHKVIIEILTQVGGEFTRLLNFRSLTTMKMPMKMEAKTHHLPMSTTGKSKPNYIRDGLKDVQLLLKTGKETILEVNRDSIGVFVSLVQTYSFLYCTN